MRRTYLKQKPVCKTCGKEMILDDVDYDFEGKQDEYWLCETCFDSVFVKVRYGKVCKAEYSKGENNE